MFKQLGSRVITITQEIVSVLDIRLAPSVFRRFMDLACGPRCGEVVALINGNYFLVDSSDAGVDHVLIVGIMVCCHWVLIPTPSDGVTRNLASV